MTLHFEELWELSEKNNENLAKSSSSESIFQELFVKIDFYRKVNDKEISLEEKYQMKNRLFGEILVSLTKLSVKDNINTYAALFELTK